MWAFFTIDTHLLESLLPKAVMHIIWDDANAPALLLKVSKRQKIREIKSMIEARTGIPESRQSLVLGNVCLLDEKGIDFYRLRPSATLKCVYKGSERAGTRMQTEPCDDLETSFSQIRIPTEESVDGNSSFALDRTFDSVMLEQPRQKRANSGLRKSFLERLKEQEERTKVRLVKKAPDYRTAFPGFNVLAECRNEECPAYNDVVYVAKGFGIFRISALSSSLHCPECHKPAEKRDQYAFYKAQWRFTGLTAEGVRRIESGETQGHALRVYESEVGKGWLGVKLTVTGTL